MIIYKIQDGDIILAKSDVVLKGFLEHRPGVDDLVDNMIYMKKKLKIETDEIDNIRSIRTPLILEADIEINKRLDSGVSHTEWSSYRQALRDVTEQNPLNVVWPNKPVT
jgi:hypothetical protein